MADELALLVYRETAAFPKEELFGLTSQVRRAAVSVASNIAEGCGRSSDTDFLRFLDMANGSLRELQYQISLANRLGYFTAESNYSLTTAPFSLKLAASFTDSSAR